MNDGASSISSMGYFSANATEEEQDKYLRWQDEYLSSERIHEIDSFSADDDMTLDTVSGLVQSIQGCCKTNSEEWEALIEIYERIPDKYKIDILVDNFYTESKANQYLFFNRLHDAISRLDLHERTRRTATIREQISEYIDEQDMVTIYRGGVQKICSPLVGNFMDA